MSSKEKTLRAPVLWDLTMKPTSAESTKSRWHGSQGRQLISLTPSRPCQVNRLPSMTFLLMVLVVTMI